MQNNLISCHTIFSCNDETATRFQIVYEKVLYFYVHLKFENKSLRPN